MEVRRTRSVGGIVIGDHGTVAMVHHKNGTDMWLFPKGRAEEGETDEETARREITEETGLTNLELLDDLGSYERHHILPDGTEDKTELKTIQMYLFAAQSGAVLAPTMEIDAARWVPLARVVDEVGSVIDRAWFVKTFERVRQAVQRD